MIERYPDIEVYIKRASAAEVIEWLAQRFGVKQQTEKGPTVRCLLDGGDLECVIVENAVKGGFTSVWFKSADTPWETDRDCALEVHKAFSLEVRCSAGSWAEDDEDTGAWLRLTSEGETRVNWL